MVGCDQSSTSIIGSGTRRSQNRKAGAARTAIAANTSGWVRMPPPEVGLIASSRALTAMVNSKAPPQSMLRLWCSTFSCRNSAMPATASTPRGTLIQNTQAQEMCCTMKAPARGPITAETPHTVAM